MSFWKRLGAMAGVVLIAAFAVGCGGTVVDSTAMEEDIAAYIEKTQQEDVKSVDCPSDQPVDPGLEIRCEVTLKDGKVKVATAEVTNKDADYRIARYGGSNE
jgi:Asp-tRNA(Asn)/Glu-tRNA(Gln) amidotransferase C subunit